MSDAPLTSNELCDSLRRIADTIEANGGWRIAAIKVRAGAKEIDRLNMQWEKAARLLNEFRPVTGTDEWVAVRVGALNYVLMAASPTPAVGPLRAATPEPRDG